MGWLIHDPSLIKMMADMDDDDVAAFEAANPGKDAPEKKPLGRLIRAAVKHENGADHEVFMITGTYRKEGREVIAQKRAFEMPGSTPVLAGQGWEFSLKDYDTADRVMDRKSGKQTGWRIQKGKSTGRMPLSRLKPILVKRFGEDVANQLVIGLMLVMEEDLAMRAAAAAKWEAKQAKLAAKAS